MLLLGSTLSWLRISFSVKPKAIPWLTRSCMICIPLLLLLDPLLLSLCLTPLQFPNTFLSQSFCTCSSLCPELTFPEYSLTSFRHPFELSPYQRGLLQPPKHTHITLYPIYPTSLFFIAFLSIRHITHLFLAVVFFSFYNVGSLFCSLLCSRYLD